MLDPVATIGSQSRQGMGRQPMNITRMGGKRDETGKMQGWFDRQGYQLGDFGGMTMEDLMAMKRGDIRKLWKNRPMTPTPGANPALPASPMVQQPIVHGNNVFGAANGPTTFGSMLSRQPMY